MVRTFSEKSQAVVDHFQEIFAEPEGCPIIEILKAIGPFLRLITSEINEELDKYIIEDEIQ